MAINGDSRRPSASGSSPSSRTASSTSWWRPTSRPAGSTWTASRTCSTTTSRTTRSPTCTASGAPAGPGARVRRCCSSPPVSGTCSTRSSGSPAGSSSRSGYLRSTTSTRSGSRSSTIRSPSAQRAGNRIVPQAHQDYERDHDVPMPTSPPRWRSEPRRRRVPDDANRRRTRSRRERADRDARGRPTQAARAAQRPVDLPDRGRQATQGRSLAPSSARSPTRAACTAAISVTFRSGSTTRSSNCRRSCRTKMFKALEHTRIRETSDRPETGCARSRVEVSTHKSK